MNQQLQFWTELFIGVELCN